MLAPPWLHSLSEAAIRGIGSNDEIVLGVSAAFSGPSRGLGTELYRGAKSYFNHINENGGVNGRKIVLKLYDDGYQPDPCVQNTVKLMLEDQVFLLFGYVGTPTVTRVLPMLKKFQDQQVYLFFPFTGAQPQREPPTATSPSTCGRPTGRRPPAWWTTSSASGGSASPCSTRPTPMAAAGGPECGRP